MRTGGLVLSAEKSFANEDTTGDTVADSTLTTLTGADFSVALEVGDVVSILGTLTVISADAASIFQAALLIQDPSNNQHLIGPNRQEAAANADEVTVALVGNASATGSEVVVDEAGLWRLRMQFARQSGTGTITKVVSVFIVNTFIQVRSP